MHHTLRAAALLGWLLYPAFALAQGPLNPVMNGLGFIGQTSGKVASTEVTCNAATSDDALIQGLLTTLAADGGAGVVHGQCNLSAAITKTFTKPVALKGDGSGQTVFSFTSDTDGFNFKLDRSATNPVTWGAIDARGFTIRRGPSSPAMANTAFKVWVNPTLNTGYGAAGLTGFTDVKIQGSAGDVTSSWKFGMSLSGVTSAKLDNVTILGMNGGQTDLGDIGLEVSGPNINQFGVSYGIINSNIVGGSCGMCVTGYVQGVFATNSSFIGNYDSVRAIGIGNPKLINTSASAASGATTLQFAANSLTGFAAGDVVDGTGLAGNTRVSAVNNAAGTITIVPATTGTVASGTPITFQNYLLQEEITLTNVSLAGTHRGALLTWGGWHSLSNLTILHFAPAGAAAYAAIEMRDSNAFTIGPNPGITGQNAGTEKGIVVTNTIGGSGSATGLIIGNNISSITGRGIELNGAASNILVTGNNINGVFGGCIVDVSTTPDKNTIDPNNVCNGVASLSMLTNGAVNIRNNLALGSPTGTDYNISIAAAAGKARQTVYTSGTSNRWLTGVNGVAESGGNLGSDYFFVRFADNGSGIDTPLTISRQNGMVTASEGLLAGGPTHTNATITLDAVANSSKNLNWTSGGLGRWLIGAAGPNPGSNVGDDLQIVRYNDNGSQAGNAITINRQSGVVNAPEGFKAGGPTHANGIISLDGSAGSSKNLQYLTGGLARWLASVGGTTDDFSLVRYTDAGNAIGTPLFINRATGEVKVETSLSVGWDGSAGLNVNINAAAGNGRNLNWTSAGLTRWTATVGGTNSGGNTGDDFSLYRANDAGTYMDAAFTVNRASGDVQFNHIVNAAAYKSGAALGVSCAGPPTASFQVTNGIVTRC